MQHKKKDIVCLQGYVISYHLGLSFDILFVDDSESYWVILYVTKMQESLCIFQKTSKSLNASSVVLNQKDQSTSDCNILCVRPLAPNESGNNAQYKKTNKR